MDSCLPLFSHCWCISLKLLLQSLLLTAIIHCYVVTHSDVNVHVAYTQMPTFTDHKASNGHTYKNRQLYGKRSMQNKTWAILKDKPIWTTSVCWARYPFRLRPRWPLSTRTESSFDAHCLYCHLNINISGAFSLRLCTLYSVPLGISAIAVTVVHF